MKLSVIVPVYQVENTLSRCVESICAQSVSDLEIILVDDGSTDASPAICDQLAAAPNIKVVHQANAGLSVARNVGVARSEGEIVTFVDSDDFLLPGILPRLVTLMEEHPEYDLVEYSVKMDRRHVGTNYLTLADNVYTSGRDYWLNGRGYEHSYAWNKVFRRHLLCNNLFPAGKVFEDVWFMPQVLRQNPVVRTLPVVGYCYMWNDGGITATATAEHKTQLLEANLVALQTLGIAFPSRAGAYINKVEQGRLYLSLVNQQITAYAAGATEIVLPYCRVPLKVAGTFKLALKSLALNVFGLRILCKLFGRK